MHQNPLATHDPQFTQHITSSVSNYNSIPVDTTSITYPSTHDVKFHITKLKSSKAPGSDSVHNVLIKKLPYSALVYLTFIICCCFKLSYFPSAWKTAKVIAVKKPGKNPSEVTSYRPISLLSSLSKILEKIIVSCLNQHINNNNILPEEQHGFRQRKSTCHHLHHIRNHVRNNLSQRLSTGMILVDVEKAFDRVWHNALIFKLINFNFPKHIVQLLHNYLENRSFVVNVAGKRSQSYDVPFGVPQGSCISQILYNIYTADTPQLPDCHRALFADDIAFYVSSSLRKEITIPL